MPTLLGNSGSTARDFCMLERNCLAHIKLALVLSLLSSAVLLRVRLAISDHSEPGPGLTSAGLPIASLQFAAALGTLVAGMFEYHHGYRDLKNARAFLVASKPHFALMTVVAAVILTTCIVLLADEQEV